MYFVCFIHCAYLSIIQPVTYSVYLFRRRLAMTMITILAPHLRTPELMFV